MADAQNAIRPTIEHGGCTKRDPPKDTARRMHKTRSAKRYSTADAQNAIRQKIQHGGCTKRDPPKETARRGRLCKFAARD
ncbi:MAG: hypothetical protein WCT99_08365 [Bacteroidota bacterium]